jgi:uncharacterized protein (DUF2267 family)
MDARAFYRLVRERVNGLGIEESKRVTAVVLRALRDRLTREEAEQVAAQLPRPLKEIWSLGDRPGRRPLKLRRDEFLQRVKHEAGLLSGEAARRLTEAVFAALKTQLSPGEAEDVAAQLPRDLRALWTAAARSGREGPDA